VHPGDVQESVDTVLVIDPVLHLFPWLPHLFADIVYYGPNQREALGK
jgi:hypothetical protein